MRFHRPLRSILPVCVVLALAACNDEPDFPETEWTTLNDTVTLYTTSFEEHQGLPSAYDIRFTRTQRVEDSGATPNWDFALTGGAGEPLMLAPLGVFFDVSDDSGFNVADETFEEVDNAPSRSDAYVTDEPVEVEEGVVYIARSRTSGGCVKFAKLQALEIDQVAGTLTFEVTANPNCNDTALVPPED